MTSTYLDYKIYANNMAQTLQRTAASPATARETQYYEQNIGSVSSVSDFVNNYQLFSYAMQAYGLSDMTTAKAFMTKVLESNLSDSTSFVNTLTDSRYKAFAEAFSFTSSGSAINTATTQSQDQENDTIGLYTQHTSLSSADASTAEQYYQNNIGSVTSVSDLVSNSQLMNVVLTAYGIDPSSVSQSTIVSALESDPSDPNSMVNQSGNSALQALAADFNFDSNGQVTNERLAQSQTDFQSMASAYMAKAGTDSASQSAATSESTYVGGVIAKATSLDQITSDPRVVAYIGQAFGVTGLTAATLGKVLTSDVNDMGSFANQQGDAYRQIAADFNFTTSGTIARPPAQAVQSKEEVSNTVNTFLNQQIQTQAGAQSPGRSLPSISRKRRRPSPAPTRSWPTPRF